MSTSPKELIKLSIDSNNTLYLSIFFIVFIKSKVINVLDFARVNNLHEQR
jgi:hypothetical protein